MEVRGFVFEIIPLGSQGSECQVPGKGQHDEPDRPGHHEVVDQYKYNGTGGRFSIPARTSLTFHNLSIL